MGNIYINIQIYTYIYLSHSGQLSITTSEVNTDKQTNRVLKSCGSKMSVIYSLSWEPCTLLVISTMALWQLMHLGTWCTSCAQVHELSRSHCGDNVRQTLYGQSLGFACVITTLMAGSDSFNLTFSGMSSRILWAKNNNDLAPLYTNIT